MPRSSDLIPGEGPRLSEQPTGPITSPDPAQPLPNLKPAGEAPGVAPVSRIKVARLDYLEVQTLREETKDPNKHYRWTKLENVNKRRLQGYEIEPKEGGAQPIAPADDTGDGTTRMGDLILMSCPREHREGRQALLHKVNQDRLGVAANTVKEVAAQAGVKLKDHEEKETYELRPS
jgi:hypothetical protein